MNQNNDKKGKKLDSLTKEEKSELDQSLGADQGPESLEENEQEEIEEMALEASGEKKPKKAKEGKKPKPIKAEKPKKKPQPQKSTAPKKQEEPDFKKTGKSGKHPEIKKPKKPKKPQKAKEEEKSKKWQPRPVKPQKAPTEKPAGFEREEKTGSIWSYFIYGGVVVVGLAVILFALAFVDAKGYMNLGFDGACESIGMENGCLPFIDSGVSPVDEMVEIRQAFEQTSSHNFESIFEISLPASDFGFKNLEEEESRLVNISGQAQGTVSEESLNGIVKLTNSISDRAQWQTFIENDFLLNQSQGQTYLKSESLGFEDNIVKVGELGNLSSLSFLTATSGGILNISKEDSSQGLNKYTIEIDPSGIEIADIDQPQSAQVVVYNSKSDKLPKEVDIKISYGQEKVIDIAKKYSNYNGATLEGEEEITESKRQLALTSFAKYVAGLQLSESQRDQIRKADLSQIQSALEAYYQDKAQYPVSADIDMIDRANSLVAQKLVPDYLSQMPIEPLVDDHFYGYQSTDGEKYILSSIIENSKDPEAKKVDGIYLYKLKSTQVDNSANSETEGEE